MEFQKRTNIRDLQPFFRDGMSVSELKMASNCGDAVTRRWLNMRVTEGKLRREKASAGKSDKYFYSIDNEAAKVAENWRPYTPPKSSIIPVRSNGRIATGTAGVFE